MVNTFGETENYYNEGDLRERKKTVYIYIYKYVPRDSILKCHEQKCSLLKNILFVVNRTVYNNV